MTYEEFIHRKTHLSGNFGFEPVYIPDFLFDYQKHIVQDSIRKGRFAIFADTGLGKTAIQLTIAHNLVLKTNRPVLILTPLAVAFQFLLEAAKIGIDDIEYSKEGKHTKKIVICNYERLHYFNSSDFDSVILDESSILKNFDGKIKGQVTAFMKKLKYRYLSTATPAPNDYIEFGTSSEALGYLPYMDMLQRYFANNENNVRPQDIGTKWYLKPHAKNDFFRWVNTWSMTVKKPSDLGYSDERHVLPKLIENLHYVKNNTNWIINGQMLAFNRIAKTMTEVSEEQKTSIKERCEKAVELASGKTSVYWCNLNPEGDLLDKLDKDAVQIKGGMTIEKKEEILIAFSAGEIKRLITKPKITSFGLNWQHCNHTVAFPTWSYEKDYQLVRRFWRFGQLREVTVDRVVSDGQKRVIDALQYKTQKAQEFGELIKSDLLAVKEVQAKKFDKPIIKPTFL